MRDANERTSLLEAEEERSHGALGYAGTPPTRRRSNSSVSRTGLSKNDNGEEQSTTRPARAIVSVLLIGVFVANVDISLVIASSSKVSGEFEALDEASWLFTSFSLAQCASQPLYGKLSDIFGRKTNLVFAYVMFAAGCFLCGNGRTYSQVLAGRAISGIGGAGMTALVSIVIADLVPVRQIAALRSYVNVVATIGRSMGGPVGGWLADTVGWRWSFNGQVPLTLVGLVLILYMVPSQSGEDDDRKNASEASLREKMKRVDIFGAIALASTISTFLLALDFVAKEGLWYHILVLASLTVVCGVTFYVLETAWTSYMIAGAQAAAQTALFYLVPIYFQITARASVASAGFHMVPAVVGNSLGGLLSGFLISRTGRYKYLTITASVIAFLAYLLVVVRWRGSTSWPETLYLLMGGFGTAIIQSTMFIHLAASLDASEMAIAGTTLYLAQSAFALVGVQLATTILRAKLRMSLEINLEGFGNKRQIIENSLSSVSSIWELARKIRSIVIAAYVDSMSYAYGLSVVFAVFGLMFGISIQEAKT